MTDISEFQISEAWKNYRAARLVRDEDFYAMAEPYQHAWAERMDSARNEIETAPTTNLAFLALKLRCLLVEIIEDNDDAAKAHAVKILSGEPVPTTSGERDHREEMLARIIFDLESAPAPVSNVFCGHGGRRSVFGVWADLTKARISRTAFAGIMDSDTTNIFDEEVRCHWEELAVTRPTSLADAHMLLGVVGDGVGDLGDDASASIVRNLAAYFAQLAASADAGREAFVKAMDFAGAVDRIDQPAPRASVPLVSRRG